MYVSMYVRMYVCMYVYMLCMYVCMHACMHACKYDCIHICMYCMYCMYCMCACVHVCMYACVHVDVLGGTYGGPSRANFRYWPRCTARCTTSGFVPRREIVVVIGHERILYICLGGRCGWWTTPSRTRLSSFGRCGVPAVRTTATRKVTQVQPKHTSDPTQAPYSPRNFPETRQHSLLEREKTDSGRFLMQHGAAIKDVIEANRAFRLGR